MIGLMWALMSGMSGDMVSLFGGSALACCAICGLYKCSQCRIRDCACCKRLFRALSVDSFDDFELLLIVHEVLYNANAKAKTKVKVTAGQHQVETEISNKGIFQQPLSIFVEQGTSELVVELLNGSNYVLANKKFRVQEDILAGPEVVRQKLFPMKQKEKGILNPRVKLTILKDGNSEEDAIMPNLSFTESANNVETTLFLREQIWKHQEESAVEEAKSLQTGVAFEPSRPLSELEVLARGCEGPLETVSGWGNKSGAYLAVQGPPKTKKYTFCVWPSQVKYERGEKPDEEIEVLKVLSVQPDPGRPEVFMVNYMKPDKTKHRTTFMRLDRGRDAWVELLQLFITKVREEKDAKKK